MTPDASLELHAARFAELDTTTLYDLLRLREAVFVVEQACPYPELDGRDAEPTTVHRWFATAGGPVAYLRTLADSGETRIGRVATDPAWRGHGLAARLMADALEGPGPFQLDAQADRSAWYERFGFTVCGPPFDDFGILHVPMRRP